MHQCDSHWCRRRCVLGCGSASRSCCPRPKIPFPQHCLDHEAVFMRAHDIQLGCWRCPGPLIGSRADTNVSATCSGATEERPEILQYTCRLRTNVRLTKTALLEVRTALLCCVVTMCCRSIAHADCQ
jgi:hypothetical protein